MLANRLYSEIVRYGHKSFSKDFLTDINKEIDSLSSGYENFLIIGDFNCEIHEESMSNICQIYDIKNLINEPTCYKWNPGNPSCIDLIMTNKTKCFQNSITFETALSDFHKITTSSENLLQEAEP